MRESCVNAAIRIDFIPLLFRAKIVDMSWNIYGHEWAVDLLRQHINRGEMRHAYLFSGPQSVGRRTLALEFAKAINCRQPQVQGEPCGVCTICKKLDSMQQVDLAVVESERLGGTIKVEQVRELQHKLSLSPYEASYRVALLIRFQEANANAQNALLKVLEEPPPRVVLLLTVDTVDNLLPTVASRCEVLRLRPMSVDTLQKVLVEQEDVDIETAGLYAHLSAGRLGLALRMMNDPSILETRVHWLSELGRLLKAGRCERFAFVDGIYRDRDKVRDCLQTWLTYWRDVMINTSNSNVPLVNIDRQDEINQLAALHDLTDARQRVADIDRAIHMMDTTNTNIRLLTEVLLLDWPRL